MAGVKIFVVISIFLSLRCWDVDAALRTGWFILLPCFLCWVWETREFMPLCHAKSILGISYEYTVCNMGWLFWLRDQFLCRFIYTLLSLGIIMCLLTCSGHIAAETANSPCLSCVSLEASDTRSCVSLFKCAYMAAATGLAKFLKAFCVVT